MPNFAKDDPITFADVARRFGCCVNTIVSWHKNQGMPGAKLGGTWFTTWADVYAWSEQRSAGGRGPQKVESDHVASQARELGLNWD